MKAATKLRNVTYRDDKQYLQKIQEKVKLYIFTTNIIYLRQDFYSGSKLAQYYKMTTYDERKQENGGQRHKT